MLGRVFSRIQPRRSHSHNEENLPTTRKNPKITSRRSILAPLSSNSSDLVPDIYANLLRLETHKITSECLSLHSISQTVRARMVEWMVEVISVFHMTLEALFLSVKVMDVYLLKSSLRYTEQAVHLIGVTCLLLASKFEEVETFSLKTVVDVIAKRKFTGEDILNMELLILDTIGFEMHVVTPLQTLAAMCQLLNLPTYVQHTATIILVINQMFLTIQAYPASLQAVSSLSLVLTSLQRTDVLAGLAPYSQGRDTRQLSLQMKANVVLYHRENPQSTLPKHLHYRVQEGLPVVIDVSP